MNPVEERSLARPCDGSRFRVRAVVSAAFWAFVASSVVVMLGVGVGRLFSPADEPTPFLASLARFDGHHYQEIATSGYSYDRNEQSTVAFFPLYPLLGRICAAVTTLSSLAALVAVSNVALFMSLVLLGQYMFARCDGGASRSTQAVSRSGCPAGNTRQRETEASLAVVVMALFPTTLFFHMAYSESLFLLLSLVSMWCIEQRRPAVVTAIVIGVTTGVRPVGVALLVPFVLDGLSGSRRRKLLTILLLPISIGGLLGYMAYQFWAFGDALAFARTQAHWKMQPPLPFAERGVALFLWQPILSVYSPSSPSYWDNFRPSHALLNWQFANPIYFGLAAMLLVLGAVRRWLNAREVGLGVALLAIPYATRAYEMGMNSQARFASVVFPVYIVLGRMLASASCGLRAAILAVLGSLLLVYCTLFAAGYPIF